MDQLAVRVEKFVEPRGRHGCGNLRVPLEFGAERAALRPDGHRRCLHLRIGVLAAHARLRELQQHMLREDEAAQTVEIPPHGFRINDQLLHHAREPVEREIEGDCRIRADHPLDGRMGDIPLMPERDILKRGNDGRAHHARKPGQVFRQHRIALVRHGGGALLPGGEELLRLPQFRALQVPDFDREPLDAARDDSQHGEEHGVPVARDHLRRMGLGGEAQFFRHMGLDARIDAGERADGSGNGAGRNLRPGGLQAGAVAGEFGIVACQLHAEGGGLRVDGVAAADAEREFVLTSLCLQCREEPVEVRQKNVAGARKLHCQAGVEHVG